MHEVMIHTLEYALTGILGALAGAFIIWLKDARKKNRVFDDAVKALAHDSFYRMCRYLLDKKSITESELENLNYLHDAYTALGMNGTGEELYKRCLEKKIE